LCYGFCFLYNPVMRSPKNWLDTACMIYNRLTIQEWISQYTIGWYSFVGLSDRFLVRNCVVFVIWNGSLWGYFFCIILIFLWCFTDFNLVLTPQDVTPLDKFLSHLCIDQKNCTIHILLPNTTRCHTFGQSFVSRLQCSAILCFYVLICGARVFAFYITQWWDLPKIDWIPYAWFIIGDDSRMDIPIHNRLVLVCCFIG